MTDMLMWSIYLSQAVVKSTSNMLEEEKTESWKDLPQAQQAEAATRVIKSVEDSAFQVAKLAEAPTVKLTVDVNIGELLLTAPSRWPNWLKHTL